MTQIVTLPNGVAVHGMPHDTESTLHAWFDAAGRAVHVVALTDDGLERAIDPRSKTWARAVTNARALRIWAEG